MVTNRTVWAVYCTVFSADAPVIFWVTNPTLFLAIRSSTVKKMGLVAEHNYVAMGCSNSDSPINYFILLTWQGLLKFENVRWISRAKLYSACNLHWNVFCYNALNYEYN